MTYAVEFRDGRSSTFGEGAPQFVFALRDESHLRWLLATDATSAALAFVRGDFDILGDPIAAVRYKLEQANRGWKRGWFTLLARLAPRRLESFVQSRQRACDNIRFHYDRSGEFYRQFLDSRMVYSCAYFRDPAWSIDQAQLAKLDHICRKLDLRPGERFFDIGCGWGALVIHAADAYGAQATGCTLSQNQHEYAVATVHSRSLEERVELLETDYRNITARFNKIASIGMFEHVGRRRLGAYFRKVYELLEDDGLFLNHGIVRPQFVKDNPQTYFIQRKVFPGGELPHLSDVIREAENNGFEVLDVENLRPHYALTARSWVSRLLENSEACRRAAGEETYRTWVVYLSTFTVNFEDGQTEVHQVLFAKRGKARKARLTRDYMYHEGCHSPVLSACSSRSPAAETV